MMEKDGLLEALAATKAEYYVYRKEFPYLTRQIKRKTVIIEALEKQIPEVPVGDLHSVPHYRCPNCHKAVQVYENDPQNPACHFCGQLLSWEAITEEE